MAYLGQKHDIASTTQVECSKGPQDWHKMRPRGLEDELEYLQQRSESQLIYPSRDREYKIYRENTRYNENTRYSSFFKVQTPAQMEIASHGLIKLFRTRRGSNIQEKKIFGQEPWPKNDVRRRYLQRK